VEFRWVAIITLWTLIVGPIFDQPSRSHTRPVRAAATAKANSNTPATPAHAR
jgi:hypothetical protein